METIILTQKYYEILDYIFRNGLIDVAVSPAIIRQNKNFYGRIKRLEIDDMIIITRNPGMMSVYSITQRGVETLFDFYKEKRKNLIKPKQDIIFNPYIVEKLNQLI